MNRQALVQQIKQKHTYLCVGLDTDMDRMPKHLLSAPSPLFEFNKQIIDATKEHCVSYKLNTAFYEAMGIKGWEALQRTVEYIPSTHFKIADAKRGDIGNTSAQYAKTFFETFGFDAVTVAPYMGEDSVTPFLNYKDKWAIVLALTSNEGSADFQRLELASKEYLFEAVLHKTAAWGNTENMMFVVGATRAEQLKQIRQQYPNHFFLVPGVGAQGGDLKRVSEAGLNDDFGLLVNVSRNIIYAGAGEDFAEKAAITAMQYADEMKLYLAELTTT